MEWTSLNDLREKYLSFFESKGHMRLKSFEDSLVEFEKAERSELSEQAKAEIEILKKYLPEPLSDEELRVMVAEAISETGAEGPKAIGKVMPAVMAKAKGRADGKRINQMVRELLQ